jgi:hypothetical protein
MEPFGGIEQLAWSPDSKSIAYTCRKKTGLEYSISTDSDIYLYNIGTRETVNLCKPADYVAPKVNPTITLATQAVNAPENLKNNVGYDQNPQFSPDGKYIAWLSMERDGYEADLNRLCIYSFKDGTKRYIDWKSDVEAFCWAPQEDKQAILYLSPNLRNCINEVYPEFPTVACCYQEIKCRDKDKDLNNICNNKKCIISKVNKTFIHNYIKKMKMSDYNIKSVSVQCSSNYLNLFFSSIFLIFCFIYL